MLSKVRSTEKSTNKKEIGDINGSHDIYFVCDLYKEQRTSGGVSVMSDTLVCDVRHFGVCDVRHFGDGRGGVAAQNTRNCT